MPSPLSKLRSSVRQEPSEENNWGVDARGQFLERAGRTKLCSQLDPEDKRYVEPLNAKDLSLTALRDLIQTALGSLKGFKALLYSSDTYFHARYTHRVVHATDDIEVYVCPPGVIHFRCSTKDSLNGLGSRHRHRMAQLLSWLQPRVSAATDKELAERRTVRIHEWDSGVERALKPNGHFEPNVLDDPTSIIESDTPE
jgi:uncharacterized protein (DUF1499 family)